MFSLTSSSPGGLDPSDPLVDGHSELWLCVHPPSDHPHQSYVSIQLLECTALGLQTTHRCRQGRAVDGLTGVGLMGGRGLRGECRRGTRIGICKYKLYV